MDLDRTMHPGDQDTCTIIISTYRIVSRYSVLVKSFVPSQVCRQSLTINLVQELSSVQVTSTRTEYSEENQEALRRLIWSTEPAPHPDWVVCNISHGDSPSLIFGLENSVSRGSVGGS
jgi:hypothetical protein